MLKLIRNHHATSSIAVLVLASCMGMKCPRVANPDAAETQKEQNIVIDVLANDNFSGSPTIESVEQPVGATVRTTTANKLKLIPDPGFVGYVDFSYTASDGTETGSAVVTVLMKPPFSFDACALGPYVDGQNPEWGGTVTHARLRELLREIRPFCNGVRIYGTSPDLLPAAIYARQLGFETVLVGAWLGTDMAKNDEQIDALIGVSPFVDILSVGSEVLLEGDLSASQLIGYIDQVKNAVPDKPVCTSEVYHLLIANQDVMDACRDVVLAHIHPYWDGIDVADAVPWVYFQWLNLTARAGEKEVIISEVGWKDQGSVVGGAVPSPENQVDFMLNLASFIRDKDIKAFYFAAFDEPWKGIDDGWGYAYSNLVLKPQMLSRVFAGESVRDNWSREDPVCGIGSPSVGLYFVSPYGDASGIVRGQVLHVSPARYVVAVYIKVRGGWWTKPAWDNPTTFIAADGKFTTDITTGGVDREATEIRAYVIPADYTPPEASGGGISSSINDHAVAMVSVTRPDPELTPFVNCN